MRVCVCVGVVPIIDYPIYFDIQDISIYQTITLSKWCVRAKVLTVRQEQLEEQMEEKRKAREECERRRAELLQQLEEEEVEIQQQREEQERQRTAHMHDISAQVCVCVFQILQLRFTNSKHDGRTNPPVTTWLRLTLFLTQMSD